MRNIVIPMMAFLALTNPARAEDDFSPDRAAWMNRITNHSVIAHQRVVSDFIAWCNVEEKKPEPDSRPCPAAEKGISMSGKEVVEAAQMTKQTISNLKSAPDFPGKSEHIAALQNQIEVMKDDMKLAQKRVNHQ